MRAALRDKRRATAIEREAVPDVTEAFLPEDALRAAFAARGAVHVPVPGEVFRCQDGTLYAVDGSGAIHVARDEEGRKMRAPKVRRSPFLAPPVPVAPEPGLGDSQVAPPPEIGPPGATSSEIMEGKRHHAHVRELSDDLSSPTWIEGAECADCPKLVTAGVTITDVDYASGTVTANTEDETPRCCENECEDRAEHDEFDPGP